MDQELKAKWVEALRSGEYKQCKGTLFDGVAYCCLGVLCKVAGRDGDWRAWSFQPFLQGAHGLTRAQAEACADLNDGDGKTFAEIAEYIEKEIPADVPA